MICYIDDIRINIVIDELTVNNKKKFGEIKHEVDWHIFHFEWLD